METHTNSKKTTKIKPSRRSTWDFVSMSQCSAFTGTPMAALRDAKERGCLGFKTNQGVDFLEFLKWHWKNSLSTKEVLDLENERALLTREQRVEKERENKIAEGQLYKREEMDRLYLEGVYLPLRQGMEAMPEALGTLVNPTDPAHAKKVLREWLERIKSEIRQHPTQ